MNALDFSSVGVQNSKSCTLSMKSKAVAVKQSRPNGSGIKLSTPKLRQEPLTCSIKTTAIKSPISKTWVPSRAAIFAPRSLSTQVKMKLQCAIWLQSRWLSLLAMKHASLTTSLSTRSRKESQRTLIESLTEITTLLKRQRIQI